MLTRRDLMRSLSLSVLAVAAADLLGGCSSGSDDGGDAAGIVLVSSEMERADGDPAAVPDAVGSIHALGARLYGELSAIPGNLAISPYSVALALALALNGAGGTTLDEMLQVLATEGASGLNGGLNALTRHVDSLAGEQERRDGSTATIALDTTNALFGEKTETWNQDFLDTLAREYGAGMQAVDFKTGFEAARPLINDWVAERTHDRIEDLIPEGGLNALTRLVLVNAVYLKAPWEFPFEKDETADKPFHLDDGSEVTVPTMHAYLEPVTYAAGDGWQAIGLPYAGGDLAMTVVLPDEGEMADLESKVGSGALADILAAAEVGYVELTLPKWTFRTEASLGDTLSDLGMPTAFTDAADFTGMTIDDNLAIGAVQHQVFIAVNEEGTEAAAATAVTFQTSSAPAELHRVVVDRPFLFVIHDVAHATPLFVGRVADPR